MTYVLDGYFSGGFEKEFSGNVVDDGWRYDKVHGIRNGQKYADPTQAYIVYTYGLGTSGSGANDNIGSTHSRIINALGTESGRSVAVYTNYNKDTSFSDLTSNLSQVHQEIDTILQAGGRVVASYHVTYEDPDVRDGFGHTVVLDGISESGKYSVMDPGYGDNRTQTFDELFVDGKSKNGGVEKIMSVYWIK